MVEYTSEQVATFNMALATLERIDLLLRNITHYNVIGNIHLVKKCTYEVYKELYPFLKEAEVKKATEYFKRVEKHKIEYLTATRLNYPIELGTDLYDFDLWIRLQLKNKGLLMAQSDNGPAVFEGM